METEYVATVEIETDALVLTEEHMGEAEAKFMEQIEADTPHGAQGAPRLIKICHRLNHGKAEYTFSAMLAQPPAPAPKAPAMKATPPKAEKLPEEGV